jgi:hypothetical protein
MVDSLPPSGTDPDNKTIMTNSNGKLSVPLDGETLDVGSSGKVEVFDSTQYYLADFEQDSGDWTGFDEVEDGIATVLVDMEYKLPKSASVTADLTGIDVLTFRIDVNDLALEIKFDGIKEATIGHTSGDFETLQISGLDHYGPNTTVTIEATDNYYENPGDYRIDYVRSVIQPASRKIELVDTGGLE